MRKKILAVLLAAVMVMALLPTAFAASGSTVGTKEPAPTSGTCGDNLTWTLVDGVLTISGTGAMDDYTVEERSPWYSGRSEITSVVIENGVTSIGARAFPGCDSLTGVTIPNSVTTIGAMAFIECSSLTSVTIPDSVANIEFYAFAGCNSLTGITIEAADVEFASDVGFAYGMHTLYDENGVAVGGGDWTFDVTIFGYNGSTAQAYAENNAYSDLITFVSLGDAPAKPTEPTEPAEPTGPKPETPEITFKDVPANSWYASSVSFAVKRGLIEGDGKGNFNPNNILTRAQTFAILARLDGKTITGNNWAETATQWAVGKGVSTGENSGSDVTREQLVVMMWRYAGEPDADTSALSGYSDRASLHNWGMTAMAWAVKTGVVEGDGGKLMPQDTANRAQAVTIIQRYCASL